jgi:hypothetical protein
MSNTTKNTIIGLLIIIILILGYLALKPKTPASTTSATTAPVTTTTGTTGGGTTTTPPSSQSVSVAGMQEYTDSNFGFSFWYPDTWTVTTPTNAPFGPKLQNVSVVAELGLQPAGQTYPDILIQEAHSTTRTITDTGGAGPIGPITYYFDTTSHLWMTTNSEDNGQPTTPVAANISNNTMGGLHLFGGTSRFNTEIIPLSADNFVVIGNGGDANSDALAKTVLATDPSVATPVSTAEQIQTIETEKTTIQPQ